MQSQQGTRFNKAQSQRSAEIHGSTSNPSREIQSTDQFKHGSAGIQLNKIQGIIIYS